MEQISKPVLTVQCTVNAPVDKVWDCWTNPEHIIQWCNASPDWHAPRAENDLRPGGSFVTRMEAKDGSFGFDFGGVYDAVETHQFISYTMSDGRRAEITFTDNGDSSSIVESFEAESENSLELQQSGWQAILDNFKKYTESR